MIRARSRRIYGEKRNMSANLEKAIQEEVRELTDEQQRQVMAFVETFNRASQIGEPGIIHLSALLGAGMARCQLKQSQSLTRLPTGVRGGVCVNGGTARQKLPKTG